MGLELKNSRVSDKKMKESLFLCLQKMIPQEACEISSSKDNGTYCTLPCWNFNITHRWGTFDTCHQSWRDTGRTSCQSLRISASFWLGSEIKVIRPIFFSSNFLRFDFFFFFQIKRRDWKKNCTEGNLGFVIRFNVTCCLTTCCLCGFDDVISRPVEKKG